MRVWSAIIVLMLGFSSLAGCIDDRDRTPMPETYEFTIGVTNASGEVGSVWMPVPIHTKGQSSEVSEVIDHLLDSDQNLHLDVVNGTHWLVYSGVGDETVTGDATIHRPGPYFASDESVDLPIERRSDSGNVSLPFIFEGPEGSMANLDWRHDLRWDIYCSQMLVDLEEVTLAPGDHLETWFETPLACE